MKTLTPFEVEYLRKILEFYDMFCSGNLGAANRLRFRMDENYERPFPKLIEEFKKNIRT